LKKTSIGRYNELLYDGANYGLCLENFKKLEYIMLFSDEYGLFSRVITLNILEALVGDASDFLQMIFS
jgi:Mg2+/Co2+ transporter CorC